ncbi:Hsp20/alpha crystallin family protein [Nitrosovibrio sp. Nv4]|uniref:Hsp20/alpha crystallin family protein n=1 Tax=Nitrosovibrio sp. Nv4 TaxID=1945880 RepID=UPI000BC8AF1F|nr:Hsp20/alpha crystallin family protein [Nitrosovibrio sp. Nv4]SOD41400.1 heat shock protein Hsp20 [Nitrosovibrio sp. Nv4]
MIESLKHAKTNISRGLGRTWDHISEGWRELAHHSSDALTHFVHRKDEVEKVRETGGMVPAFRTWSLLAGEMEETDKEILVRIEVPGMEKEDCQITIDGNMLYLRGEKRFERARNDSTYHVMERAYGVFQRAIPLPSNVDADHAEADYRNGVLTVHLPKLGGEKGRLIPIS